MARVDIHEAAFVGNIQNIVAALDHGQDPKEKDRTGTTALHKAAANGHLECLQLLVERGGDINQPDITGSSSLHAAARNGHIKTVRWLVKNGSDIRTRTRKGNSAEEVAKRHGQFEVSSFLRECGREKFDWEVDSGTYGSRLGRARNGTMVTRILVGGCKEGCKTRTIFGPP